MSRNVTRIWLRFCIRRVSVARRATRRSRTRRSIDVIARPCCSFAALAVGSTRSVAIFRGTRNGVRPISVANNWATAIAFGGPRLSCVRPGAHSARHQDSRNDLTPCRMAWHFVSAGAHAPDSDQTLGPTPTPGAAYFRSALTLPRFPVPLLGLDRKHLLERRHQIQTLAEQACPREALVDAVVEADEMDQNAGEKGRLHPDPEDHPTASSRQPRTVPGTLTGLPSWGLSAVTAARFN